MSTLWVQQWRTLSVLFAGFFIAIFLSACGDKVVKVSPISAQAKVLILGDSITAHYALPEQQGFAYLLARATGWQVINAGVSGDTASGGLSRLSALLAEHHPSVLIIELGGNDFLQRQPNNTVKSTLRDLITTAQKQGITVILMAVPEFSLAAALGSVSDSPIYAELAKEHKIPVLANTLSAVLSNSAWRLDQVHPNAEGHRVLAERVLKELRRYGAWRD